MMPMFRDRASGTCLDITLGIALAVRDGLRLETFTSATGETIANCAVTTIPRASWLCADRYQR